MRTNRIRNSNSGKSSLAFQVIGEGFALKEGVAGHTVAETDSSHDAADAGRFYRPYGR